MEYLISDLGGVVLFIDTEKIFRRLACPHCGIGADLRSLSIMDEFLGRETRAGKISSKEYWRKICLLGKKKISFEEFADIKNSAWSLNEPYIKLLEHWKNSGRKLALLSNLDAIHWRFCKKNFPVFELFDQVFLSYRLKRRKPDYYLFLQVLEKLQIPPSSCLFIDDQLENIRAAFDLGLDVFWYSPDKQEMLNQKIATILGG